MKKINVITPLAEFKSIFQQFSSLIKRHVETVELNVIEMHSFGYADDNAYSGTGTVIRYDIMKRIFDTHCFKSPVIHMSPDGVMLDQTIVKQLASYDELTIVCSRYEGLDERAIEDYVTHSVSIGDYVVSNGDLPAMILLDSIFRLTGMVKNSSLDSESFSENMLDIPCYTRPFETNNKQVPNVYVNGNHVAFNRWKKLMRLFKTAFFRSDLLQDVKLDLARDERKMLKNVIAIVKKSIEGDENEKS